MNSQEDKGVFTLTQPIDFELQEIRRPRRPHFIEQVIGLGAPRQTILNERTVIGRAPEADVCIDSLAISREHLIITRNGPEYSCEDCDSTNGVFLNGVRIQSAVLREGDHIQIGDVGFIYHEGA